MAEGQENGEEIKFNGQSFHKGKRQGRVVVRCLVCASALVGIAC